MSCLSYYYVYTHLWIFVKINKYYNLEYPRLIDLKDIEVKVYLKCHHMQNQLEKLEAAKAAWLVYLSLLSLNRPYLALLGLAGPYLALLTD